MEKPDPLAAQSSSEEDEDTMSLSEFSIYCDQDVEPRVEDLSKSDEDEHDFQFSSEMVMTSHDSSIPIVFCGKLIHVSPKKIQNIESKKHRHMHPGTGMERKVSILASKRKSRWYLFVFGFGSRRFPTEMHIGDLRKRQTSVRSKCNDDIICDECDRHRMGKSRGWIKLLGCCVTNNNEDDGDRVM